MCIRDSNKCGAHRRCPLLVGPTLTVHCFGSSIYLCGVNFMGPTVIYVFYPLHPSILVGNFRYGAQKWSISKPKVDHTTSVNWMSIIEKFSEDTKVLDQADICVFPSSISMWSYGQVGWQIKIIGEPGNGGNHYSHCLPWHGPLEIWICLNFGLNH